jgi:hypothetical protein
MSLRRSRKQSPVKKAAKLWAGSKLAKALARKAPGRRTAAIAAGIAGLAGVTAARKRRAKQADLPYGPPNESVPSHETLAPAKEAADQDAPDPEQAAKSA